MRPASPSGYYQFCGIKVSNALPPLTIWLSRNFFLYCTRGIFLRLTTANIFFFPHHKLCNQGYLPFDKTGDWLYHAVEIVSLFASGLLLFAAFGPLKSTYEDKFDRFGNLPPVPAEYGAMYLIAPALFLAIFFHPNLNKEFFSDTCWTFSMYIEAVAMLPQIYMFQKQAAEENGMVEAMIGHTTFALGFSRVFELIFWVNSFRELANETGGKAPGYIVLLSQLAHLVIMADFF